MATVFTNPDDLPGQNRKKLDETAGRRLAATGIAAAFAASVAMLGCPVGGAFAAPPTVQVDVVNPATSPALTRSVDDPGRIAYQSTVACVPNATECFFHFPAVPQNHRLVVQHVSAALGVLADSSGAHVVLEDGVNEDVSSFLAPPSFQREIFFDQPVLHYFDAGSAPFLFVDGDVDQSSVSKATISGYLLDCATTPCEAIAH